MGGGIRVVKYCLLLHINYYSITSYINYIVFVCVFTIYNEHIAINIEIILRFTNNLDQNKTHFTLFFRFFSETKHKNDIYCFYRIVGRF